MTVDLQHFVRALPTSTGQGGREGRELDLSAFNFIPFALLSLIFHRFV